MIVSIIIMSGLILKNNIDINKKIQIPIIMYHNFIKDHDIENIDTASMKESDSGAYQEVIEDIIDYAKIPVKAMLGRSSISVNDYINIQIGDIIKLDTKVNDELEVYVGNIKKFTALPGATKDSYAVRVTSVIREEQ